MGTRLISFVAFGNICLLCAEVSAPAKLGYLLTNYIFPKAAEQITSGFPEFLFVFMAQEPRHRNATISLVAVGNIFAAAESVIVSRGSQGESDSRVYVM